MAGRREQMQESMQNMLPRAYANRVKGKIRKQSKRYNLCLSRSQKIISSSLTHWYKTSFAIIRLSSSWALLYFSNAKTDSIYYWRDQKHEECLLQHFIPI